VWHSAWTAAGVSALCRAQALIHSHLCYWAMGQVRKIFNKISGCTRTHQPILRDRCCVALAYGLLELPVWLQAISGGLTQRDVDDVIQSCNGACEWRMPSTKRSHMPLQWNSCHLPGINCVNEQQHSPLSTPVGVLVVQASTVQQLALSCGCKLQNYPRKFVQYTSASPQSLPARSQVELLWRHGEPAVLSCLQGPDLKLNHFTRGSGEPTLLVLSGAYRITHWSQTDHRPPLHLSMISVCWLLLCTLFAGSFDCLLQG